MTREEKLNIFKDILNQYETDEMREYCSDMIDEMDSRMWNIPSSTSFKYHNKTQCQSGGQCLHVLMACTIMNYLLGLEYLQQKWDNPIQRDCLRTAIALHDSIKCGNGDSKYTVHEHPVLAQKWIEETNVKHDIDQEHKKYIGRLVASHSGQWVDSKKSKTVLPKPENDEQFIIHLCDYLSSRSNIDMSYTDDVLELIRQANPIELPEISEYKLPFGKYKGFTLLQIKDDDPGYISWAKENMTREPVKSLLKQI